MVVVMACGGDDESAEFAWESAEVFQESAAMADAPQAMGRIVTQEVIVEKEVMKEIEVEAAQPQAAAAAPTSDLYAEETRAVKLASDDSTDEQAALVSQRRIIVRTADMALVVDDVSKGYRRREQPGREHGRLGRIVRSEHEALRFRFGPRFPPIRSKR